jgi:hypothetical protein
VIKKSMLIVALAAGSSLFAQQGTSEVDALKSAYATVKGELQKAAEAMPEDQYSFKPVPAIRSFGEVIAHVTDAQGRFCSIAAGSEPPPSAGSKTAKADLVAALNHSFEICDGVFENLKESDSTKTVKMGRMGERNEFGLLWTFIIGHSNEQYGYAAVYLRLKGVVPPSSAGRGMRGR